MTRRKFSGLSGLRGTISVPGDKSIAHRSVILSALSGTACTITNFPTNDDCLSTVRALTGLGISISGDLGCPGSTTIIVRGKGLYGLRKSARSLRAGESGTTLRLMLGVLAGQRFPATLCAGPMLSQRPMARVTVPLRLMGARITGRTKRVSSGPSFEEYPPLTIYGGPVTPITYKLAVASAQVKSAILLAGLYARGRTRVIEPVKTRDHTERLLSLFKAGIKTHGKTIVIQGGRELAAPGALYVPGDISSASFFIVLGLLAEKSRILIREVSLNPSRTGILRVLKRMGAQIKVTRTQRRTNTRGEPAGDIEVKTSRLKATTITEREIPSLIDELPVLMVAACRARGRSVFQGVQELRVKETDRIASMTRNLMKMGADIRVAGAQAHSAAGREDMVIRGVAYLKGAKVKSFHDHRTAMSMIVAGLCSRGTTSIDDVACINKSFPGFLRILTSLTT